MNVRKIVEVAEKVLANEACESIGKTLLQTTVNELQCALQKYQNMAQNLENHSRVMRYVVAGDNQYSPTLDCWLAKMAVEISITEQVLFYKSCDISTILHQMGYKDPCIDL